MKQCPIAAKIARSIGIMLCCAWFVRPLLATILSPRIQYITYFPVDKNKASPILKPIDDQKPEKQICGHSVPLPIG